MKLILGLFSLLLIPPIFLGETGLIIDFLIVWFPLGALSEKITGGEGHMNDNDMMTTCSECGAELRTREEKERGTCDQCDLEDQAIATIV